MIVFSFAAADYVATRRAMGYKFDCQGQVLGRFITYLEAVDAKHLTIAHALSWAKQPSGGSPVWWAFRLGVARGFARYLRALDPATEVPPAGLLPDPGHRITPYIYSEADLGHILEAAGRLTPTHRADTYQTLIGLLAITGMRVGEAVRLDRDDLDVAQGLLTIRDSKYGKSRQVPLHSSTVEALAAYGRRRDERRPKPKGPSVFTSTIGTRLLRDNVCTVFPRLLRDLGLARHLRRRPRLHDLRHTFAVRTVIDWYRRGLDVERRMPLLSTYLGHIAPSTTYWYLSAVPELLEIIADRLDSARGSGR